MISSLPPSRKYGGAEEFCRKLSMKLSQSGIEVAILTSNMRSEEFPVKELSENIEIIDELKVVKNRVVRKSIADYFHLKNIEILRNVVREIKPDIVHFHNVYGAGTNLFAAAAESLPTIATIHDYWPFCFNSIMIRSGCICSLDCWKCKFPIAGITRLIKMKHLQKVFLVAPSDYMFSKLTKAGYNNVRRIYNGIDLPDEIILPKYDKRMLFVGRITEEKGVKLVCEVSRLTEIPLDVIGDGKMLQSLMAEYKDAKVISFRGFVENVEQEYLRGGVMVFPSIWPENLPTAPLEAMSFGLPVVASRIGGLPEIVQDGQNGKLFEPGSLKDLILSVEYVLDSVNYSRLSSNCISFLRQKFDWRHTLSEYMNVYRDAINCFSSSSKR
ncbi:MAG: glycosyltransferase [Methanomassiliicoccales archaeon]|nr:glycosyltransferase [Methanomassiliicoccales archaeon]